MMTVASATHVWWTNRAAGHPHILLERQTSLCQGSQPGQKKKKSTKNKFNVFQEYIFVFDSSWQLCYCLLFWPRGLLVYAVIGECTGFHSLLFPSGFYDKQLRARCSDTFPAWSHCQRKRERTVQCNTNVHVNRGWPVTPAIKNINN